MTLAPELLPGAIADLDSIYSVDHWRSAQAETYLRALNARMQGLRRSPALGMAQGA